MGGRCNHRRPCRSPSDRAACGGREGGARLLDAKCNAGWPADVRGGRTRGEALKLAARGKAIQPASAAGRVAVGSSVGFTPASRVGLARKSDGDPIRRRRLGWSLAQEKNKHTGGARRRFERCLTRRFALPAGLSPRTIGYTGASLAGSWLRSDRQTSNAIIARVPFLVVTCFGSGRQLLA